MLKLIDSRFVLHTRVSMPEKNNDIRRDIFFFNRIYCLRDIQTVGIILLITIDSRARETN